MDRLTSHISKNTDLGETKAAQVARLTEILMEKLLEFRRRNHEIYRFTIDKAVIRDFTKTLK